MQNFLEAFDTLKTALNALHPNEKACALDVIRRGLLEAESNLNATNDLNLCNFEVDVEKACPSTSYSHITDERRGPSSDLYASDWHRTNDDLRWPISFSPVAADIGLELLQQTYFPVTKSNFPGALPQNVLEPKEPKKKKKRKRHRTCDKCERSFLSRRRLFAHRKTHFPDKTVCSLCGAVLESEREYSDHLRSQHGRAPLVSDPDCDGQSSYGVNASSDRYTCITCGFKADYYKKLYRHGLRFGHQTQQEQPPKPTQFVCSLCNYSTTVKCNMTRHIDRKHSVRGVSGTASVPLFHGNVFLCETCGGTFATASNLTRHMRCVHEKKKTLICECGREFSLGFHLTRHREKHCPLKGGHS